LGCAEQVEETLFIYPLAAADNFVVIHGNVGRRAAKGGESQFAEQQDDFEQVVHFHSPLLQKRDGLFYLFVFS
jgi:hypothetical protein